jgi:hypothetical protein
MAYNAVAQLDEDAVSHTSASDTSDRPSSVTEQQTSAGHHAPSDMLVEAAEAGQGSLARGRLDSLLAAVRSRSNSYEMVEDDDYEIADPESVRPTSVSQTQRRQRRSPVERSSHSNSETLHSTSPEPLVRTPSGSVIPLRHPTPDLQSLQGAYVGNVERLEKSAERLSMSSSDLGLELRRLDGEQKRRSSTSSAQQSPVRRFSTASLANSIMGVNTAARTGGYSSSGFLSSPRGSILSGSRLRSTSMSLPLPEVDEPNQAEDHVDGEPTTGDGSRVAEPPSPPPVQQQDRLQELPVVESGDFTVDLPERSPTARSTDTYQQATNLFLDFDGVHFVPHPTEFSRNRPLSRSQPHQATAAAHYEQPQEGQDLVYYPAPIPKVLNLPQRLSKRPPLSHHEKRRTQLLNTIAASDKKAAEDSENRKSKALSTLPPQLRASVYFNQPGASLDIQIKDQSAVTTLDSILDASAHAPVTAFTDHPIVGSVGREVYAKAGKKRSSRHLADKKQKHASRSTLAFRESTFLPDPAVPGDSVDQAHSDVDAAEATPLQAREDLGDREGESSPSEEEHSDGSSDESVDEDESSGSDEEEEDDEPILFGRPTTLLAELEMRKQEQKQRNRTAATAFPNGMHSTLLQLDAVAQAQSNSRRQKQITLAWEAGADADPDAADDEDVPLGVLFGNKNPELDERRPIGLMERRELEENEPLSRRRARLRGEGPADAMTAKRASAMTQLQSHAPSESDSGDESETLAQRLHRLREEKREKSKSVVSTDFEDTIMAELSKLHEPPEAANNQQKTTQPAVDHEEETLGQRRKRLQAEKTAAQTTSRPNLKARRSMADILQAYPTVDNTQAHRASMMPTTSHPNRMSTMYTLPPSMTYHGGLGQYPGPGMIPGYGAPPLYGAAPPPYGDGLYNTSFLPNVQLGMNGLNYNMPYTTGGLVLPSTIDPKQREVIDRWRQSVLR